MRPLSHIAMSGQASVQDGVELHAPLSEEVRVNIRSLVQWSHYVKADTQQTNLHLVLTKKRGRKLDRRNHVGQVDRYSHGAMSYPCPPGPCQMSSTALETAGPRPAQLQNDLVQRRIVAALYNQVR
jgi:hypothetical protein